MNKLNVALILVALTLIIVVFYAFDKEKMPLKYALVWLFPSVMILFFALIPNSLFKVADLVGFQTVSNLMTGILFVMMFFVCISLTIIVSSQTRKITQLIQEISILKSKINEDYEE